MCKIIISLFFGISVFVAMMTKFPDPNLFEFAFSLIVGVLTLYVVGVVLDDWSEMNCAKKYFKKEDD